MFPLPISRFYTFTLTKIKEGELIKENIYPIEISERGHSDLDKYSELLREYNKVMNLTAITDENEIRIKHFADSLSLLTLGIIEDGASIADVGTGAGFPGLPLKIAVPSLSVTLIDALEKRIGFLNTVIEELSLKNITAVHKRAEDAGREPELRESFDAAVSRAVAPLSVLAEYSLPLVKKGGYFLAMKGPEPESEVSEAKNALEMLGGKTEGIKRVSLADGIVHSIVIIKKISQTPQKYPRKAGKPAKSPLK